MADDVKDIKDLYKSVKDLSKTYKSINEVEFVKSGSVVFDALLGGGIPRGLFILWSSESGCGKSTGALHISKAYCLQGLRVLYLDYEGGVNSSQIDGIGLRPYLYNEDTNPEGPFILFQCTTYKDGEKILDKLMSSIDLVVIDSMTAISPEKLKEVSSEDSLPGLDARILATFMRKYKQEALKSGTTWIMINQYRTKIAVGYGQQTQDVEAGGNALQFYSDIRLVMKKAFKGQLEQDEETSNGKKKVPFGRLCEIKAKKNRYERPEIPLNLAIMFGKGIENSYAYFDFLENMGAIKKSGAWYEISFNGHTEKFQGSNRVVDYITANKNEVKKFIDDNGGYKLLMNKGKAIDISGETNGIDVNSSVVEDFENIISESDEDN